MNLTAYELSIIAGLFTIAGALIAVFGGYWLAKKLATYTYKLQKLDEIRSSIITNFRGLYPIASDWPKDIKKELHEKNIVVCELIQQCKVHMKPTDFSELIKARDKHLNDAKNYIPKQDEASEILYNNANSRKGQERLHENIDLILSCTTKA